jgi:hypothetical protein
VHFKTGQISFFPAHTRTESSDVTFSDTMEQLQESNHRHALQPGAVATNPPPAGDHNHPSFSNSSRVSMAHLLVPNQQEL